MKPANGRNCINHANNIVFFVSIVLLQWTSTFRLVQTKSALLDKWLDVIVEISYIPCIPQHVIASNPSRFFSERNDYEIIRVNISLVQYPFQVICDIDDGDGRRRDAILSEGRAEEAESDDHVVIEEVPNSITMSPYDVVKISTQSAHEESLDVFDNVSIRSSSPCRDADQNTPTVALDQPDAQSERVSRMTDVASNVFESVEKIHNTEDTTPPQCESVVDERTRDQRSPSVEKDSFYNSPPLPNQDVLLAQRMLKSVGFVGVCVVYN